MDDTILTERLIEATYLYCYKRLANSSDAQDLAQDILYEALRALRSGREIRAFYPWYWALAANRLRMFLQMKRTGAVSLDPVGGLAAGGASVDEELLSEEEIGALHYAVSRLSSLHREVVVLYYLREMKVSEIAARLSVPVGTVKRRLYEARIEIEKGMVQTMTGCGKTSFAPAEPELRDGFAMPRYWKTMDDLIVRQILAACVRAALRPGNRRRNRRRACVF